MSSGRTEALLVTPMPPMKTGLATYALKVLESTAGVIDWTVACQKDAIPDLIPSDVRMIDYHELRKISPPDVRIFQLGNSPHCFPVVQALYDIGGTALFHETVLHHMLRDGYLTRGRLDDYHRELRFCYGPAAERVRRELNDTSLDEREYDELLKKYPLSGRAVNASSCAACLNEFSASLLRECYPEGALTVIGHPLRPLPKLQVRERPFETCIGMVGSWNPGRNLQEVLRAMETIRLTIPNAGLVLIGDGYPCELPPWTVRTGRLDEPEYQSWIRTLDIVVDVRHPHCGETSGSLLEAMRAGIPPVVTASGSFVNLPSDAVIRVPYNSVSSCLPKALRILLDDDSLRRSMSEKAMAYALDIGSAERLKSDWDDLIRISLRFGKGGSIVMNSGSCVPAWNNPPDGFIMDTGTDPVTWRFSGRTVLLPCGDGGGATLTAWGAGDVNGIPLKDLPSVMELEDSDRLVFSGEGYLSYVHWH